MLEPSTQKLCPKCNQSKPLSAFVAHRWCQDCKRASRRASYERNRETEIARAAAYNAAHPDAKRSSDAAHYLQNKTAALFRASRTAAKRRGIQFLMTFAEWLSEWGENFGRRGTGRDDLCMARHNDEGPYAVGNVSIITNKQNLLDRDRFQSAKRREQLAALGIT